MREKVGDNSSSGVLAFSTEDCLERDGFVVFEGAEAEDEDGEAHEDDDRGGHEDDGENKLPGGDGAEGNAEWQGYGRGEWEKREGGGDPVCSGWGEERAEEEKRQEHEDDDDAEP